MLVNYTTISNFFFRNMCPLHLEKRDTLIGTENDIIIVTPIKVTTTHYVSHS